MAPRSRGAERALTSAVSPKSHICRSCRESFFLHRRTYASAATATAPVPPVTQVTPQLPASTPLPQPKYTIKAGVLLSRPPIITPDPHPFETAYHLYQRRLNERLVLPFTQYFYFKRGTPAFETWRTKKAERGGVATRDVGKYNAYTEDSWNDEVSVGDETAQPRKIVEQLIEEEGRAGEFVGQSGLSETAGLRRRTEADEKNDERSLQRLLQRTLYLMVRSKSEPGKRENWTFPSGALQETEGLHQSARRVLDTTCGPNMNTWFVARHPVGHFIRERPISETSASSTHQSQSSEAQNAGHETQKQLQTVHDTAEPIGEKTFFIKGRIFAGQANLKDGNGAFEDFKWLAKDEIEKLVHPMYWARVKNMLVER